MAASSRTVGFSGGAQAESAPVVVEPEEFKEITLADIVRVLHRRRAVLAAVVALSLLAGAALTLLATRQYEAQVEVIPVEHADIVMSWFGSRQAAAFVVDEMGGRLNGALYPNAWDESAGAWTGTPPSQEDVALALTRHVDVTPSRGIDPRVQRLTVAVTLPDALLARDVAAAYLRSLDALRPSLENLTRAQLFDEYFDGSNGQDAQRRAEAAAQQREYWVSFDTPAIPTAPVTPRPVLNMALAGALGLALGLATAFFLEWLGRYRADFKRLDPPRS